jgi:hypothetical protein
VELKSKDKFKKNISSKEWYGGIRWLR